jgi:hypothetical protein
MNFVSAPQKARRMTMTDPDGITSAEAKGLWNGIEAGMGLMWVRCGLTVPAGISIVATG